MKNIPFILPPQDILKPNHIKEDPLRYYYRPLIGYLYRKRIQNGLDMLESHYHRILEFGYGSGILLPSLAKLSHNLHGIDIASKPSVVNNALNKLNIKANLAKGDITRAKYPSNYFDLIIAFSVFEHITNPDAIFSTMHRILKPDGTLLVGMPRVDRFMDTLFMFIGYSNIDDFHVLDHKIFINKASRLFSLQKQTTMAGLYFTMLFRKK
ncbi:MAG: hypothetical protein UY16_C0005G0002 [Candidatus Gottesmanbacteria bacterium GW2011_GWA2_47_9]|uniref:Methyltransferase type 11 n=2 Tax=Microgenomates group TaxID=1794810 RepID=A0A0G0UV10_9BACT|nr:MAG: hypothetical protein UU42_C0013G0002 [Candidatus Woesebacteria bacterium GW2011_GWA1_41_13b]KKU88559.1 MAG: hypothetical protein UY16_C0005G0002 [Candidatus Gottesmanbacteria bacterium GW2011_GWA2_47_9]